MFEAFRPPGAPERFRTTGAAPLAAFVVAQMFFTIAPLFGRTPRWVLWIVDGLLVCGAAIGILGTLRVVLTSSDPLDVRALGWALATILASVLCVTGFLALSFPGL